MILRRIAPGFLVLLLLAGCGPEPSPALSPTPSPTASASTASPSPTPSPSTTAAESPTPSPWGPERLPFTFRIVGSLLDDGNVPAIVEALHRAADHLPVLKLDITETQVTLTALRPNNAVISYRWSANQITTVDSDFEYLDQATFDPRIFPLNSVSRMFDVADLNGVSGELVLQILDYRDGTVLMTVSSRPATATVFFNPDGSAVSSLGVTSVSDLEEGIAAVVQDASAVYAISLSASTGYRAELPDGPGQILTRTRMGALPVFATQRTESTGLEPFDPSLITPSVLAQLIAEYRSSPEATCTVTIDKSLQRSAPVMRFDCSGDIHYTDMEGRDMTDSIG